MDFDSRNIAAGDEVVAVVVRGRQTGMEGERGLCLLNLLSRLKIAQASEKVHTLKLPSHQSMMCYYLRKHFIHKIGAPFRTKKCS